MNRRDLLTHQHNGLFDQDLGSLRKRSGALGGRFEFRNESMKQTIEKKVF